MEKLTSGLDNPNEFITNQFYLVALAALAWGGFILIQGFFEPLKFNVFERYAWFGAVVDAIVASVWPTITWLAIGRAFSRMNEALLAILVTLLVSLATKFAMLLPGAASNALLHFVSFWLAVLPAVVFGIAYFRNAKALYLVVAVIAAKGLGYAVETESIAKFINSIVNFSQTPYVLYLLETVVELPIQYLLLHYFIESLTSGSQKILTFTHWGGLPMVRRREYSLLYWMIGTALIVASVGIGDFVTWGARVSNSLTMMQSANFYIRLFAIIVGIFVTASVYRNYLVSYFIGNGKPIGWNYYFLNIPLLNIFAWLFSLKRETGERKLVRDNAIGQNSSAVVIKRLVYILLALSVLINLVVVFDQLINMKVIINILVMVVASSLLVLYLESSRGIYIIYGVTSAMLLGMTLIPAEFLEIVPPKAHVIGLLVLYPLFHGPVFRFSAEKIPGSAGKEGQAPERVRDR